MSRTAQKAMAHAIRRHPAKSAKQWELITLVETTPGTVLTQPVWEETATPIEPLEEEVDERELMANGVLERGGVFKLWLPGHLELTEESVLRCDGQTVDIVRFLPIDLRGNVEYYRIYVKRRQEGQDA